MDALSPAIGRAVRDLERRNIASVRIVQFKIRHGCGLTAINPHQIARATGEHFVGVFI
jgi:hypothetical protein